MIGGDDNLTATKCPDEYVANLDAYSGADARATPTISVVNKVLELGSPDLSTFYSKLFKVDLDAEVEVTRNPIKPILNIFIVSATGTED